MDLRLVVGPSRLRDCAPMLKQSGEAFLFSDEAAEYYESLVAGAQVVAASFPFAAWAEPDDAPLHLGRVDGQIISGLRWSAAQLAVSGEVSGEAPPGAGDWLFSDPVVAATWDRGPEYVANGGRGGAAPAITGTERLGAFDHFLHHAGEPVIYSPADFAPVVRDNSAPGAVVLSAPRLIAEVRYLAAVLNIDPAADGDDCGRGIHALLAAAEAATTAGAALVSEYA
ncbi:hypothetical protein V6U90_24300 [Micromonospora sp. CPCC 206060]|uniref:hypothetical protein n=1 Tax=Micromonospora sp. CPCC 206060 TaxID=3122406 RepID=UPI002FF08137